MATMFYTVWEVAADVAQGQPIQEGVVTVGAGSLQSAPIAGDSNRRRRVRIFVDADVFVTWDENPTATIDGLSGRPIGAENPEYFDIKAGDVLAVIERV